MTPEEVEGLLGNQSPGGVPPNSPVDGNPPQGGVTEAEVASLFEDDDKRKDDTLRKLFDAALTRAPDKHAGVLELARRTGAPADLVEQNYDEFKTKAESSAFDPRKFRTENPRLAELLVDRPEVAPVVMRDEQISTLGKVVRGVGNFFKAWNENAEADRKLSESVASGQLTIEQWREEMAKPRGNMTLEALFPDPKKVAMQTSPLASGTGIGNSFAIIGATWDRARKGAERNSLGFKALAAKATGGDGWEYLKRATDLEKELAPEFYNQNPVEQVAMDVTEAVASQVESLKGLGVGGLTLGGLGLAVGAATKNPGAAARLGGAGLRLGATAGTALVSFEQEAGGAYLDFRAMKLDDGTPVTEETAVGMSIAAGALSAGIETLSLGPLAAAYKPLGDLLKRQGGRAFLRNMLRDRTFRNMASDLGKQWLKSGATEGLEEFLQTQTQNLFGYATRVASSMQYGEQSLPKGDVVSSLVEGVEAAQKGFLGGLAVAAPGPIVSLGIAAAQRDRAVAAAGRVAAINDAAKTSSTVKAAPDLVAKLIEQETAETGEQVTHMHVSAVEFTRFFQSNNADANDAAIELLGEDGALELAQAVATGGKLEVPLADYLEKWGGKPIADALAEHTTTRSCHSTPAELRQQEAETSAEAQRIADAFNAEQGEGTDQELRLVEEVKRQLAQVAPGGATTAEASIAPLRQFLRTQAERFGVSADELFSDFTLRVQAGEGGSSTSTPPVPTREPPGTGEGGSTSSTPLAAQAVPVPALGAEPGNRLEQAAFHGSPHRFEKFSLQKIGTGEGAQVYGHGLYFAGNKEVAEHYRRQLSPDNNGQLYEVAVPEDSELLSYEKALDEQPEDVLKKLAAITPEQLGVTFQATTTEAGSTFWGWVDKQGRRFGSVTPFEAIAKKRQHEREVLTQDDGQTLYEDLSVLLGGPEQASQFLNSIGIPGLRYLDAGSRRAGAGTHNYVIWDDGRVQVKQTFYQGDDISHRGYVEMGREDARRLFTIGLNKNADLSTFLHESGHVFLEIMGDLAAREDAPARIKEDWAKTLEFLGVSSREQIQTEQHEKWARAFEAYLMEGKAPSAALARAFQRFKLWLKSVYRHLTALNVELSDDVRGVFDRLLATDAEIERAKKRMGLQPMFRSPDEAGMSPAEWQAYLDAQEKATSRGTRAAEFRILRDRLRETERWWKEEEKALVDEALKEFDARPDAKAARFIRKGELPLEDGTTTVNGMMGRMDRQAVYDLIGEKRAKEHFGWRLLLKGGEHPDDFSELFGFPSGRELLEAVLALPDRKEWAEQQASERMQQRHPDILRERGELEAMVAKGLHGDATAEWLLREWKALRAKTGEPLPPTESIKQAAKLIVQRRKVGRLNAARALQAERSAAQKAAVAATRQDFAQAAVYKQQQLLNHYLYKELTEAQEFRDSFETLAAKQGKDKARAKLRKASPKYRDGVDVMLEALGLRVPERRETPAASLSEVVAELEANGETVAFDSQVIGRILAQPQPWAELAVAELREVYGYLRNLRQAATNRTSVLIDGRRQDKEAVIDALLADALKSLPKLPQDASSIAARTLVQKGQALVTGADGTLLKPELMLDWLAGGDLTSMWHKAINLPLQQAKHREALLLKQVMLPVVEAFQRIPPKVQASLMNKVDGETLFPSHRGDVPAPSRRFELLVMWMNSGNASNLQRLLEGRNIAHGELMAALNTLTKEEMDWAQQVLDSMESLWPLARDLEERDSGLAPEKIEATPIVTKHGTYRGGYFPAVYDRRFARTGEVQAGDAVASLLDPTFTRPGTRHNHLKGRAKDFADVIALDLSSIQAHLAQTVHDIAFREAVKSVGGLILSPVVQSTLKERLGDGRAIVFLQWLKDIGQMRGAEVASHAKEWNRAWKWMRSNFVIGAIGWSGPLFLGDMANLAVNALLVNKKHWAAGLMEFMRNPVEGAAFVTSKSGEMQFLETDIQRKFESSMKSITNKGVLDRGPLGFLREHAFTFQEWSFKVTATPLWLGAYRQALAKGESDEAAVTFADATLRKGFPSHSAVDKAAILRDKGFWGNMTLFYGYFSQLYNLQRDIVHELHTAMGFKEKLKSLPKVSAQLLALWACSSVLAELLTGRGPEDDEEVEEWVARKLLLAPLQSIPLPVAGIIESALLGKKPSVRAAPGFAAVDALGKSAYDILQSEDPLEEKKLFALAKSLGLTLGVPTRPLRAAEYLSGAVQGEYPAEDPFDVAGGIIFGPPRNP